MICVFRYCDNILVNATPNTARRKFRTSPSNTYVDIITFVNGLENVTTGLLRIKKEKSNYSYRKNKILDHPILKNFLHFITFSISYIFPFSKIV